MSVLIERIRPALLFENSRIHPDLTHQIALHVDNHQVRPQVADHQQFAQGCESAGAVQESLAQHSFESSFEVEHLNPVIGPVGHQQLRLASAIVHMHPVRAVKTPGPVGPVQGLPLLAIAAGALLWRELRHPDPVFQPRFFRLRSFAAASGAIALSNLAMYSTLLTVPLLLAARSNASTVETGLVLGALTVGMVLFAQPGGWLADRFGRRWPVVARLAVFSVGLLPLGLGGSETALPTLIVALAVAGVGLGLSSAGLQTSAVEAVPPEQAGSASGVFSTSRYFGSIVGSSVLAAVLGSGAGSTSGFGAIFLMVVIAAFLSTGLALGLERRVGAKSLS